MNIRHAKDGDVIKLSVIESLSYPVGEGAGEEQIRERVSAFPDNFWIMEEDGRILSFLNGITTDVADLTDEMYENTDMNKVGGKIFMVFSVVTAPDERGKGFASTVMEQFIADCRRRGISEIVLTCKEGLIPFYQRFGFEYESVSASVHGGAVWHQMRTRL